MPFSLPDLPYAKDALEPHMSAETFDYHYGKHHKAYVDGTNAAIDGTELADKSLGEVIAAAKETGDAGLFNKAAQIWNHTFFWDSMSPESTSPSTDLAAAIEASFGSMDAFKDAFTKAAMGQFGSGWAWLVKEGDALKIVTTGNADTPLGTGVTPLLTLDVWEHAYYIDHRNNRGAFVKAFLDELVNWDFASANFA